ncbi:MAG TPA: DMT family transporter [Paracoccaceae bacterium]|nr:DMT family transporter [Paracoccaceae bacterium]
MGDAAAASTLPVPRTGQGIALMLLAIVLFTLMDAVVKGLVDRYPVNQVMFARFAGQLIIVGMILNAALPRRVRSRHPWLHLVRALTQLAASGLFFLSLTRIGLAEATALSDINPILIVLGAALFLGERLGPRRIIGIAAAFAGALIILRPGMGVFTPWAVLPLLGACAYATNALVPRAIGPRESPWPAMFWGAAICTAATGLSLPFAHVPIAGDDIWRFVAIGCLGSAAQLCIIRSFTLAEASAVAPVAYAGIVLAALWGWLFFGEWPDGWTILGAVVIVASGLYVWHREVQAARTTG